MLTKYAFKILTVREIKTIFSLKEVNSWPLHYKVSHYSYIQDIFLTKVLFQASSEWELQQNTADLGLNIPHINMWS